MKNFNGPTCKMKILQAPEPKARRVDEVAIYNRSLGASAIKSHFEGEKLRYEFMVVNESGFSASALDDANRAFTRIFRRRFLRRNKLRQSDVSEGNEELANLRFASSRNLPLNNFSQPQYYDDTYTVLLEHFDSLQEIGWNNGTVYGNFSICDGKFGTGGCFDGESGYVVIVLPE